MIQQSITLSKQTLDWAAIYHFLQVCHYHNLIQSDIDRSFGLMSPGIETCLGTDRIEWEEEQKKREEGEKKRKTTKNNSMKQTENKKWKMSIQSEKQKIKEGKK